MNKETLKKIKEILLAQKKNLEDRLSGFTERDSENDDNYKSKFPNFGDKEDENAAEVAQFSDNLSIEHTLELDLRDVNKSLERIKQGKYGTCKYCGKEIEEKRLLVRPTSNSCVECKKKLKGE